VAKRCTCDDVRELDPLNRFLEDCPVHDVEVEYSFDNWSSGMCGQCGHSDHSTEECEFIGTVTGVRNNWGGSVRYGELVS